MSFKFDIQLNFKIQIEATYGGNLTEIGSPKHIDDMQQQIRFKISAECDKSKFMANPASLPKVKPANFSMLEIQTLIFMFKDLNICDPCISDLNTLSSTPFNSLTSFEEICRVVLFKYIKIEKYQEHDKSEASFSQDDP